MPLPSDGWPEDFLRGSRIFRKAVWVDPKDENHREECWACILCGYPSFKDEVWPNSDTHEIMHLLQASAGLIQTPLDSLGNQIWKPIDEKNLPEGMTWKKW